MTWFTLRAPINAQTAVKMKHAILFLLFALVSETKAQVSEECQHKLGPPTAAKLLGGRPDAVRAFIIRGANDALGDAHSKAANNGILPKPLTLTSVNGLALSLRTSDALSLCQRVDVQQIWHLNRDLALIYVRVIQGIEYAVHTIPAPGVINLSLGPPADLMPIEGYDDEPMNAATYYAASRGFIPVVAIGNYFSNQRLAGVVNPWCRPDWVICVGAGNEDGTSVWSNSARGNPVDPKTWPDVIAEGIDVISLWPSSKPKPKRRSQRDMANERFRKSVPDDKRDLYTLESGTSMAVPQVVRAVTQILHFTNSLVDEGGHQLGDPLFEVSFPIERFSLPAKRTQRLTGRIVSENLSEVQVQYVLDDWWKLVKQIVIDFSIEMPDYEMHHAGAGFVSPNYIEQQLNRFGTADRKILPVKVVE